MTKTIKFTLFGLFLALMGLLVWSSLPDRPLLEVSKVNKIAPDKRSMPYQETLYTISSNVSSQTLVLSLQGIPEEGMTLRFTHKKADDRGLSGQFNSTHLKLYGFCQQPNKEYISALFTRRSGGMVSDTELLMLRQSFNRLQMINLGRFLPELYSEDQDLFQCDKDEVVLDTKQPFHPCQCEFQQRFVKLS